MDRLQELIRYNGRVATRAVAFEGLLTAGVPLAWVVRYLSDAPTLTEDEAARFDRDHRRDRRGRFHGDGSAGGAPPVSGAAEPHELTPDEFARSLPGREVSRPARSLKEWAAAVGRAADAAWDDSGQNVAALIGGMLTETTRHGRGKLTPLVEKLGRYNALAADYRRAVDSGAVPTVTAVVPLDPQSGADAAYVRSRHKRLIRKAIAAGRAVPPAVLAHYPEFVAARPSPSA